MNRYFRRLARFWKGFSARRSQDAMMPKQSDAPDPRTKGERHGKVTADKWNQ